MAAEGAQDRRAGMLDALQRSGSFEPSSRRVWIDSAAQQQAPAAAAGVPPHGATAKAPATEEHAGSRKRSRSPPPARSERAKRRKHSRSPSPAGAVTHGRDGHGLSRHAKLLLQRTRAAALRADRDASSAERQHTLAQPQGHPESVLEPRSREPSRDRSGRKPSRPASAPRKRSASPPAHRSGPAQQAGSKVSPRTQRERDRVWTEEDLHGAGRSELSRTPGKRSSVGADGERKVPSDRSRSASRGAAAGRGKPKMMLNKETMLWEPAEQVLAQAKQPSSRATRWSPRMGAVQKAAGNASAKARGPGRWGPVPQTGSAAKPGDPHAADAAKPKASNGRVQQPSAHTSGSGAATTATGSAETPAGMPRTHLEARTGKSATADAVDRSSGGGAGSCVTTATKGRIRDPTAAPRAAAGDRATAPVVKGEGRAVKATVRRRMSGEVRGGGQQGEKCRGAHYGACAGG